MNIKKWLLLGGLVNCLVLDSFMEYGFGLGKDLGLESVPVDNFEEKQSKTRIFQRVLEIDQCFQNLFSIIERIPAKNVNYAQLIGTKSDYANLFPATTYSKFKHFCRIIKSYRDYPKLRLSDDVLTRLNRILGCDHSGNDKDLFHTIERLGKVIPAEWNNRHLIDDLLGVGNGRQADYHLSGLVDELYNVLYEQWPDIVRYKEREGQREQQTSEGSKEKNSSEKNIFILLADLKQTLQEKPLPEEFGEAFEIGSLDEFDPHTLFGKAILTQNIVHTIMSQSIPVHYQRIHHLLTHETCSISSVIQQTIDYIDGSRQEPPLFDIQERFDALHHAFKMCLVERLFRLNDFWPNDWVNNSAQSLIDITAVKQADLAGLKKVDISTLQKLYTPISNKRYEQDSLIGQLVDLTNVLLHPDYVLDDAEFALWDKALGSVRDTGQSTILGLLNFCRKNLALSKVEIASQENEALLGIGKEKLSVFQTLVQRLIKHALQTFEDPIVEIQSLVTQALDQELKTKVVSKNIGHILPFAELNQQVNRLAEQFFKFYSGTDLKGVDLVFDALAQNVPTLCKQIKESLSQSGPVGCWFDRQGVYGHIQAVLQAIEGLFLRQELRRDPPSYAFLDVLPHNLAEILSAYPFDEETGKKVKFFCELLLNASRFANETCFHGWIQALKKNKNDQTAGDLLEVFKDVLDHFYGLFLIQEDDYQHSLRQDLTEHLLFLQDKFPTIGREDDPRFADTLFGRLAFCEEILQQFQEEERQIPVTLLLDQAASFCNVTEKISALKDQAIADETILELIGQSCARDGSLFGILNQIKDICLLPPIVQNIEAIRKLDMDSFKDTDLSGRLHLFLDLLTETLPLAIGHLSSLQIDQLIELTQQLKMRCKDPSDPTIMSLVQEGLLKLVSLILNDADLDEGSLANFSEALAFKDQIVEDEANLFYWTYALQKIKKAFLSIHDSLEALLNPEKGSFWVNQKAANPQGFLERQKGCCDQILQSLRNVQKNLSTFFEDIKHGMQKGNLCLVDFSDVFCEVSTQIQNMSINLADFVGVPSESTRQDLNDSNKRTLCRDIETACVQIAESLKAIDVSVPLLADLSDVEDFIASAQIEFGSLQDLCLLIFNQFSAFNKSCPHFFSSTDDLEVLSKRLMSLIGGISEINIALGILKDNIDFQIKSSPFSDLKAIIKTSFATEALAKDSDSDADTETFMSCIPVLQDALSTVHENMDTTMKKLCPPSWLKKYPEFSSSMAVELLNDQIK